MYRSIFICVFLALSASAYTVNPTEYSPKVQRCIEESGVDARRLFRLRNNIPDSVVLELKTGCYFACLFRTEGMLKEDGTVNAAKMGEYLASHVADSEEIRQAYNECSKQKGANVCETMSKTMVCLFHIEVYRNRRLNEAKTPVSVEQLKMPQSGSGVDSPP